MDGGAGIVGTRQAPRPSTSALLPVVAVLVPLFILALVGWLTWRAVWDDARSQMLRTAESAAEYGERTLESYSIAAGRLNERLRGLSDAEIRASEAILHKELRRIGRELSQTDLTYVISHDGYLLLASNVYPVPLGTSLADREYFKALRDTAAPEIHVTRTFLGWFDGRLLFSVSRRRRDTGNPPRPDGFDGVVLVSISPHTLADGMRRLMPDPSDRMALMRADGFGISTTDGYLDLGTPLPRVDPASPFHEIVAQGAESGVYLSRTAMPGTTALLAMRRVKGFAVYAVAIRASSEIAGRWWALMAPQLGFGIPATLGLLLLSLRVRRDQMRLAASNADLLVDNALSTDRLGRAERFGLVGTFEFDLRTGVSRRSAEYMAVNGLPPEAARETHEDWVRRLHPDDRDRAEATLRNALSQGSFASEYGQTYRVVSPAGEVRWIAARGEITRDDTGRAVMLRGAHVDVTPLRTTELALAESDARLRLAQEAVEIGTWEWSRATRLFLWSRKMIELWGFDPAGGQPDTAAAFARIHPADRWTVRRALARAQKGGRLLTEFRILRPRADGETDTVWLIARARMLTEGGQGGDRMMGVAYDVTERKRAEAQAELLAHEVEHRAKNALTLVAALVRMTVADTHADFVSTVQGRITALANATTLLGRRRWRGASLRELIEQELAPFRGRPDAVAPRIILDGADIVLSAEQAQPLCMALHELVTNAAKYGALSVPEGTLSLTWWTADGVVHLRWVEQGGPKLQGPPTRGSFGSRLIAQVFKDQLRGRITKTWAEEGLSCSVTFPHVPG